MFAKLKHVAIVSDRFTLLGRFYQSLFGMRSSKPSSDEPRGAAVVGDGYVGLNINSRAPGRQCGLDHFGFEVKDVETVYARLQGSIQRSKFFTGPVVDPLRASAPTIPQAMCSICRKELGNGVVFTRKANGSRNAASATWRFGP